MFNKFYFGVTRCPKIDRMYSNVIFIGRQSTTRDRIMPLPVPVDTPGEWVPRKKFQGQKSFGWFTCNKCDKSWMSAHAYKEYQQGCKKCKLYTHPRFMWVNKDTKDEDDEDEERKVLSSKKPHMQKLCKACEAGVCTAGE